MSNPIQVINVVKPKSKIWGIVIFIVSIAVSLPFFTLQSMINTNNAYPFPMDAYKIGRLAGGVIGYYFMAAILSLAVWGIFRIFKKKKSFVSIYSVMLFIEVFLTVVSLANGLGR